MTKDEGQPAAKGEPNPVARLTETLGRLPRYLALARSLAGDPAISRWRKAALAAGIVYLASPIDLVPGLIPVAGQLDDLAAVLLGLRVALQGASPAGRAAHLDKAGLREGDIGRDLAIVRGAAGWLARKAGRTTIRAGRASVRASVKVAAGATRLGIKGAKRLAARRAAATSAPRAAATSASPKRPSSPPRAPTSGSEPPTGG